MSTPVTRSALFIDFENVVIGAQKIPALENESRPFKIKPILEFIENKYNDRPLIRRAYADWRNPVFSIYAAELFRYGVEMKHIPHHGIQHKNAADMFITVDAMECLKSFPDIGLYFIVSGDSDFTPLITKLREYSKRIIGCGIKTSTSNLLVQSCDDFYYYLTILMEMGYLIPQKAESEEQKQELKDPKTLRKTIAKIFYKQGENTLPFSQLKQLIKREQPDFAEWEYGYNRFGLLMEDLIKVIPNLTIEKGEHGRHSAVWRGELAEDSLALSEVKDASEEVKENWEILFEELRNERKFIVDPATRKEALDKLFNYIKSKRAFDLNELFKALKTEFPNESHRDLRGTVQSLYYGQMFKLSAEDKLKDIFERTLTLQNKKLTLPEFLRAYYRSLLYKPIAEQKMKWTAEDCAMAFMYSNGPGAVQFFQDVIEDLRE